MLLNPQKTLEEIFCFMLGQNNIDGKLIKKRIQKVVEKGQDVSFSYKPKAIGLNKNSFRYSQEHLKTIREIAGKNLYYFGYVKEAGNDTGYFEFPSNERREEFTEALSKFKQNNEAVMKFLTKKPEKARRISVRINDKSEVDFRRKSGIPPFDPAILDLQNHISIDSR